MVPQEKKRKASFYKMQAMMGTESAAASEVVSANMHADEEPGKLKKQASSIKAMEKTGTAMADSIKEEPAAPASSGGCCILM